MRHWLSRLCMQLPFFILACGLVGFIFTLSALSVRDERFSTILFENTLTALCTGLAAFIGGFIAYHRLRPMPAIALYSHSLIWSLVAGIFGRTIAASFYRLRNGDWPLTGLDFALSFISALTMTFLIATGYIIYWYYSDAGPSDTNADEVLEIRSDGKLCYIPAHAICYLTAEGKKTIVHTKSADYTVNLLLKEFLRKFPIRGLMRSHKKYAVQISAIDYLRHNQSGEYLAGLAGDAFIVPVSPKFLPQIRQAKRS